jgi:hypothetical protein
MLKKRFAYNSAHGRRLDTYRLQTRQLNFKNPKRKRNKKESERGGDAGCGWMLFNRLISIE